MNRQQRRELAKRKATEAKYYNQLIDHQNQVEDWQLEINMVCLALALNNLYGWQYNGIMKAVNEYNRQILRLRTEPFEDLKQELRNKTEIEFVPKREEMPS